MHCGAPSASNNPSTVYLVLFFSFLYAADQVPCHLCSRTNLRFRFHISATIVLDWALVGFSSDELDLFPVSSIWLPQNYISLVSPRSSNSCLSFPPNRERHSNVKFSLLCSSIWFLCFYDFIGVGYSWAAKKVFQLEEYLKIFAQIPQCILSSLIQLCTESIFLKVIMYQWSLL